MAWIRIVPEPVAESELSRLVEKVRDPRSGQLDNILAIHSLHPEGLESHYRLYSTVMRGTASLPKVERELIAFVVSRLNDCHY